MLKFAWRWAEVGAPVLVHDREHIEPALVPGVIAVAKRVDHDTSIGVKIESNGTARWVWPTPLFVHPDPLDPEESCWICDENASRDASSVDPTDTKAAAA